MDLNMIVHIKDIRPGKRVAIDKESDGYRIMIQEHKSICSQYINDADKDGWRVCLETFEYTEDEAIRKMELLAKRY